MAGNHTDILTAVSGAPIDHTGEAMRLIDLSGL